MNVLVFVDALNGAIVKSAYEAVSYGNKIAQGQGGTVTVLTYGGVSESAAAELGAFGASKVFIASGINAMDPQKLAKAIEDVAGKVSAKVIVFSHDYTGKSVAPLASVRLKAGLVAGAIDYPDTANRFKVRKSVFSGKAFAVCSINTDIKIISIVPNSVETIKGSGTATVETLSGSYGDTRLKVKALKSEVTEGAISLPEAETVVSAGRGLKGPENWGMIEELAKELGAATACSRPVADIGWRPHHEHVGQTGIAIRPNLYFAIGISGAIQHLAGVNGSKVIVAINTDKEAPFFKAADYGVIGDAFQVVPRLIEAVKKMKANAQ